MKRSQSVPVLVPGASFSVRSGKVKAVLCTTLVGFFVVCEERIVFCRSVQFDCLESIIFHYKLQMFASHYSRLQLQGSDQRHPCFFFFPLCCCWCKCLLVWHGPIWVHTLWCQHTGKKKTCPPKQWRDAVVDLSFIKTQWLMLASHSFSKWLQCLLWITRFKTHSSIFVFCFVLIFHKTSFFKVLKSFRRVDTHSYLPLLTYDSSASLLQNPHVCDMTER